MTTVAARFNLPREVRSFESHAALRHNVSVGLEVEIENLMAAHRRAHFDYWQMGEDGSLRPRETSAELRFALPMFGKDVICALEEFDKWYWRPGYKSDLSSRCSLHCHVDVRDLHIEQLENFWTASLLLEGMLFSYASPERFDSAFCMPLSQRKPPLPGNNHDQLLDYFVRLEKYIAINPNNLGRLGTVEFRMHGPCVNTKRMLEWVNLLISIREGSKNISSVDLISLAKNQKVLLNALLGDMAELLLPHKDFKWKESLSTASCFAYRDVLRRNAGVDVVLRKMSSKEEE